MRKSVHTKAQQAFCRLIVSARLKAGLTQTQLAKRLRKPQSFVAKIEAGERRVDVLEFLIIAEAIGEDAARLVGKLKKEMEII